MRSASLILAAGWVGKILIAYWSDSSHPIDLRDSSPRKIGNEVLLQRFVILCHWNYSSS